MFSIERKQELIRACYKRGNVFHREEARADKSMFQKRKCFSIERK
jgi:hypothetical protein